MSARFTLVPTLLSGLVEVVRHPLGDERGYLERLFCDHEIGSFIGFGPIVQANHTLTRVAGTVRGLHFQLPPHGEAKLVTCIRGEVFDVAVDVRRGSSTFLSWHGVRLSESNHRTLAIPRGFAHGFQTLTDDCEMLYFHSERHAPGSEAALNAVDPAIAVSWPHPIAARSPRDTAHPFISPSFEGIDP